MSTEGRSLIDLGPGRAWAHPRGADETYQRLIRFISNLTLAEFTEVMKLLEERLPNIEDRTRLREGLECLQDLPPNTIRRVLTHPLWIYWVRSTGQIICALNERIPVAPQWCSHLHPDTASTVEYLRSSAALFPYLVLAAHMVAGREIELEIKIAKDEFLSLPGTGLSYALPAALRNDRATLRIGVHKTVKDFFRLDMSTNGSFVDRLHFSANHQSVEPEGQSNGKALHWLSVIRVPYGALEIDNHDSRYLSNWVKREIYPEGTRVTPVPDAAVSAWCEDLLRAFEVLGQCCSLLQEEVGLLLRSLIPVMSNNPEHSISCSNRDFWGAVQLSAHPGAALAEVLVHEYRHNILNAIIDVDPVLDESSSREAIFYSPWRKDPRPLLGLIHGIYSFMEVVGFYESYLKRYGSRATQAALAEERLITNTYRLKIAVGEFRRHAKLTRFGVELLDGIQERVEQFEQDAIFLNAALWNDAIRQIDQQRRNRC